MPPAIVDASSEYCLEACKPAVPCRLALSPFPCVFRPFPQHWFNLADLACEEVWYDSASLRCGAGIDLGREAVPDATGLLRFRHLLERG